MVKVDAHTHTEFCPHGSGDDCELMVQRAIELGFQRYGLTEHAPLPPAFTKRYAGLPTGLSEASMAARDVDAYLTKAEYLKRKYARQIEIMVGFEVDFLPEDVEWTRQFLSSVGPRIDASILSVHFLKGRDGHYWCVDDTPDDFATGLLSQYDSDQALYADYLRAMQVAAATDLGPFAPTRMGHVTLIKKFQKYFDLSPDWNGPNQSLILRLLETIQKRGEQLDFNSAGLRKQYCGEPYPDPWTVRYAQQMGIPLVFGSDAHSIAEVGNDYQRLQKLFSNNP